MGATIDHAARFGSVPPPGAFTQAQIVRALPDGLVLRHATPADADALQGFNDVVHSDPPDFEPIEGLGWWSRDLVSGGHPCVDPSDTWIVEDTHRHRIASSLALLPHRMRYDGVPFDAGQVELVGTHPDYRRRGLVRLQMEELHRASAARGHRLQWIAGVPEYYRRFGYEMALETDGAAVVARHDLTGSDAGDALSWREARAEDAARIRALLEHGARRLRLTCDVDADFWRWELDHKSPGNQSRRSIHLGTARGGEDVALLMTTGFVFDGTLVVRAVELAEGACWPELSSSVLERVRDVGDGFATASSPFHRARLELGSAHPLYEVEAHRLRDRRSPYALFVRIADWRAFLLDVAPVLEDRLARSVHAGRSGPLELSFYDDGLRLVFERGRLAAIEPWTPTTEDLGHHGFPGLTFLQLLTGYRSLAELQHAHADCLARSPAHATWIDALFPPAPSQLTRIA